MLPATNTSSQRSALSMADIPSWFGWRHAVHGVPKTILQSGGALQFGAQRRRYGHRLLRLEIEAHHTGARLSHHPAVGGVAHPEEESAAAAAEVAGRHLDAQPVGVEGLGPVDDRGIGHHEAGLVGADLVAAQGADVAAPGLVDEAEYRVVAQMVAVVEVAHAYLQLHRVGEALRQADLHPSHGLPLYKKNRGPALTPDPMRIHPDPSFNPPAADPSRPRAPRAAPPLWCACAPGRRRRPSGPSRSSTGPCCKSQGSRT